MAVAPFPAGKLSSLSSLPIIDVSTFVNPFCSYEERLKCADEIKRLCVEVGFFYVTISGTQDFDLDRVISIVREFLVPTSPLGRNGAGQHSGMDTYSNTFQGPKLWSTAPTKLIKKMKAIGKAAVHAMGVTQGAESEKDEEILVRCGTHTDYGSVTLLLDPTLGALQVLTKKDQWIKVDPIPGAFVVNVGDKIERRMNGLWKNPGHWVLERGDGYRVNVPFFCFNTMVNDKSAGP